MDERILRAILCSCESVTKDLENSREYKRLLEEDKFLPSNDIFNALCLSLTKLLSYKVSKEAYQRYTVRLRVIDVLREWCRINDDFQNFKILRDEKQSLSLLKYLLKKYLTDDVLNSCDSSDNLLSLVNALMCLASTDSYYKCYIEKLLLKLTKLEASDNSEYVLCYAVQKSFDLELKLSTIEIIYESQKCKLIEQPLLSSFVSSCTTLNKDNNVDNSENVNLTEQLFKFITKSPHIFLLVCAFLKELLVQLDHAPAVMNFIQLTLERIKECCKNENKDIVDLYPRNLQSLVILLRIEPIYHTDNSKNGTLKILENIYMEDQDTIITLLSHYPQWLKVFGHFLIANHEIIYKRVRIIRQLISKENQNLKVVSKESIFIKSLFICII
ncbi:hypothetical protein E2986_01395 [Frieseomelitta varia]|uniref:Uncharacterized protein n=1 Tax=Frieseomelitta varia TaxID=561572 RepID=A0A833VVH7_9HYME|nr:hypothetical protein E2986_01395 [Frieseomelitta varia]